MRVVLNINEGFNEPEYVKHTIYFKNKSDLIEYLKGNGVDDIYGNRQVKSYYDIPTSAQAIEDINLDELL